MICPFSDYENSLSAVFVQTIFRKLENSILYVKWYAVLCGLASHLTAIILQFDIF